MHNLLIVIAIILLLYSWSLKKPSFLDLKKLLDTFLKQEKVLRRLGISKI